MLRELAWLHTQMNRELRETFAPLFALFEIKTIVLCLRNRAIGRTGEITRLLARSLLADEVKAILLRGPEVRSTITALGFPEDEDLPAFHSSRRRNRDRFDRAAGALLSAKKTGRGNRHRRSCRLRRGRSIPALHLRDE